MKVINKENGKEKVLSTRQQILVNLLAPIKDDFSLESKTLAEIIEKFKDNPLVKYKPTPAQMKRMANDPEYILDIPKYVVEGYDDAVSNSRFDQRICDEFYERFEANDKTLFAWLNKKHLIYRVEF